MINFISAAVRVTIVSQKEKKEEGRNPPKFSIGGGTSLGNGLGQLMFELRKNFVKTTKEQKGDWKPIVFLFTDAFLVMFILH